MLSDHVFHLLGRTITITIQEQYIVAGILAILATVWLVQRFRRRRVVIVQRSLVTDQLLIELSRIAEALERIANRPADQVIAAVNQKAEESRATPFSIFGRERPHN